MEIFANISLSSLEDLSKYGKLFKEENVKINKSKIARSLNVDRRTVTKYLNGYSKPITRCKKTKLDRYDALITELLSSATQKFYYVSNLYRYMKDNCGLKCSESTFRYHINRNYNFISYFKEDNRPSNAGKPVIMFETPPGEQAQIDWKESQSFTLSSGEEVIINIFCYILSYSRYRVYFLSLEKERPLLLDFLTQCFELTGGVPKTILTDNMKTVMDKARTENYKGVINKEFEEFSKQMGFETHPCVACSPQTKSKVESPMKILDELHAYSGTLDFEGLTKKLLDINNRENFRYHKEYGKIPINSLEKEKGSLSPLPNEKIRNQYKLVRHKVKVSSRSTVRINNVNYSVPPKYFGKEVEYMTFNSKVYIYYKTNLIRTHDISDNMFNFNEEDYSEILSLNKIFNSKNKDDVSNIAKANIVEIGKLHAIK